MSALPSQQPENGEPTDPRRRVIEESAAAVGKQWVRTWRESLRADGRRVVGGWPGTLTEARARARAYVTAELRRHSLEALSQAEFEQVARATYACARDEWSSQAEPDPDTDLAARDL
ncbi:hypothetical protein LZC95_11690 [Pendulispora brunnea]|uniref:Uncharacterized protein n=1 Tax=Pendulispora brunnea TaxID=2905690 RepID=A0ABZ2KKJ7_9BACT